MAKMEVKTSLLDNMIGVGDMVLLEPLNEDTVIDNLKKRFDHNEIYVSVHGRSSGGFRHCILWCRVGFFSSDSSFFCVFIGVQRCLLIPSGRILCLLTWCVSNIDESRLSLFPHMVSADRVECCAGC